MNNVINRFFIFSTAIVLLCTVLFLPGVSMADESMDYIIGPEDVLSINVWDNKDLSGVTSVTLDGYINYQFIGKVRAEGLTTEVLARNISNLLSDGYIVDPQVTVSIEEYLSKKVFIVGEAIRPGTYYLTKSTTLVEAISKAMGPSKTADNEVIIVRTSPQGTSEQIVVDLRKALEGDSEANILVQNGDSIYLSKAKMFYVMGEVNKPGQYDLEKETTVLRAISIAGGNTEKAALNRVKIIRIDSEGKEQEVEAQLKDIVEPNDTIMVPQSYF